MNLKMKLNHRATATVTILSDTQCIFSDEVSPTFADSHFIIKSKDEKEMWATIQSKTIELAEPTRFSPVVIIIRDDKHSIHNL